jgi:uracil-DNA glycosylase
MDKFKFGYPEKCAQCKGIKFEVEPFYQEGNDIRLMLIGQDPTIARKQERVKQVLMLDQENGQIKKWLQNVFGAEFGSLTIYATNLVKCNFNKLPSHMGGVNFLKPYFFKCKTYLITEVKSFKPTLVITLGEPTHQLFRTLLNNKDEIPNSMRQAFTGRFFKTLLEDVSFEYSPCLHIKTYRVAQTYGNAIREFQVGLRKHFN